MSDFKVLDDISHIRLRSGMYIGSNTLEETSGFFCGEWRTLSIVPGLVKIINEIIDNSVDEFIRTDGAHANKINVEIENGRLDGWRVRVSDNGRGIPVDKIGNDYRPVLAWSRARAGSNFDDGNRVTVGMNGVGSFATNVFSNEFIGTTCDGTNKLVMTASRGEVKSVKVTKNNTPGTSVCFYPDLEFFNVTEISEDTLLYIQDRLQNLAVCYPGIQFKLNGQKYEFKNSRVLARTFSEHTVISDQPGRLFILGASGEAQEYRHVTYVNGLNLKNGGSHTDYFLNKLIEELRPTIKKKWKIEVQPNQIKQNLFLASYMSGFPNCKFDSQTKERLTNPQSEVTAFLGDVNYAALAKKLVSTPEIIDPIVQAILQKKELADRLALARMQKKRKTKIANHIEASSKNFEDKFLFITEGLSAIGPLISVRDSQIHGGYSLKGKVLNVSGLKPVEIIKNKEIGELLQILGLEFGVPADDKVLQYGKIAIMTDADVDGSSIFCLLINFFRIWPELFHDRRIARVMTPRYICTKGKKEEWCYTDAEFQAKNWDGWKVNYIKGLGTLSKEAYKKIVNEPRLEFITLDNAEDIASINMAFADSADARKEWMLG